MYTTPSPPLSLHGRCSRAIAIRRPQAFPAESPSWHPSKPSPDVTPWSGTHRAQPACRPPRVSRPSEHRPPGTCVLHHIIHIPLAVPADPQSCKFASKNIAGRCCLFIPHTTHLGGGAAHGRLLLFSCRVLHLSAMQHLKTILTGCRSLVTILAAYLSSSCKTQGCIEPGQAQNQVICFRQSQ